ncbi:hypothetical protein ACGYQ5_14240 [Burkholderia pseudomallei]
MIKLAAKFALIFCGVVWIANTLYEVVSPTFANVAQVLHDAMLDNRGLHE